ncbi:hypothetical protein D4A92_17795 [Rhizobium rosettiformans]|uniref:Nucleotide pyrophosphohydrolase n=1 Tax=Rhizobium rosettiformans TaxID=1368430 RepID=A0ABX7EY04_9HYPH|nr:nucleoside triphosphate pyrophosphohydrolase family protein [Rhizobium rosettiformans]QRF53160.1 hypothetical protein D4A92_17795 [Rhizobium rosettiformans]
MEIGEFQKRASTTDTSKQPLIALLGLAGEIGSLFTVYKKRLRDKPSPDQYRHELSEELGDIMWYLATVATNNGIDLEDVAEKNLSKTHAFFGQADAPNFDSEFPPSEQIPDYMVVQFTLDADNKSQMHYDGANLGDALSDNSHEEDKYRFHDAFHLAFLAHLHWSPVMRRLMKKKRKSVPAMDVNEDGARAAIVEEAVIAIIFTHAESAGFFPTSESIPLNLVSLVQKMTSKFEVSKCSSAAWRNAIFDGCRVFKALEANFGGTVEINLQTNTVVVG